MYVVHLVVVKIDASTDPHHVGRKFLCPWGLVRRINRTTIATSKVDSYSLQTASVSVPVLVSAGLTSTPEVMSYEGSYEDEDQQPGFQSSIGSLGAGTDTGTDTGAGTGAGTVGHMEIVNGDGAVTAPISATVSGEAIDVGVNVDADGPRFNINDWVSVDRRMWRGINKPGGIARITAIIENIVDSGVEYSYNVKYPVENGREKGVEEVFIEPWRPGDHVEVDDTGNGTGCNDTSSSGQAAGRDIKGRCRYVWNIRRYVYVYVYIAYYDTTLC